MTTMNTNKLLLLLLLHSLSFWQEVHLPEGLDFRVQRDRLETLVADVMEEEPSVELAKKVLSNARNGSASPDVLTLRATQHGICKSKMRFVLSVLTMVLGNNGGAASARADRVR